MESFTSYEINKENLLFNVDKVHRIIPHNCLLCSVVKADAYGLGMETISGIIDNYVDYFAVANINEAKTLRKCTQKKILILSPIVLDNLDWCVKNNIELTVSSLSQAQYIVKNTNKKVKIHIKINTGLNRYGFSSVRELKQALIYLKNCENVEIVGVFTHFATKNECVEFIDKQFKKFKEVLKLCKLNNAIIHCASSYQTTNLTKYYCDMVRIGISLYGLTRNAKSLGFKPVLEIKSLITEIHDIKAGESVGYSRTFIAKKAMKIGVVPVGYADGFAGKLGNNFSVLVNDKWCKVVGKVGMDCFMVDLSSCGNAYVGSQVVLLGRAEQKTITLQHYAKVLRISEYEVLLSVKSKRMETIIV